MSTPAVTVNRMNQLPAVNYEWGAVKWMVNDSVAPGCVQSVGYVYMLPGSTNPEHHHTMSEEVMYMIAGECEVDVGGEKLLLTTGMSAVIPIGVKHIVKNPGWEPCVYIASFSAANRGTRFEGKPVDPTDAIY
ncbi:MAG: cupin domain-containing protein [Acidobacteriota bacterium]